METQTKVHPLIAAGFTPEECIVWDERYEQSNHGFSYEEWCAGVVHLNSGYANHPLFLSGKFSADQIDKLDAAYTELYEGKPDSPTKEQYYATMIELRGRELDSQKASLLKKKGKLHIGSYKFNSKKAKK